MWKQASKTEAGKDVLLKASTANSEQVMQLGSMLTPRPINL